MTLDQDRICGQPRISVSSRVVIGHFESMEGLPIQELTAGLATFKYHVEEDHWQP